MHPRYRHNNKQCAQARQKGSGAAQTTPLTPAVEDGVANTAPHVHVRQPVKSEVPLPKVSRLQLPFAEQDDEFVEFAKSLTKLPPGDACCCMMGTGDKARQYLL